MTEHITLGWFIYNYLRLKGFKCLRRAVPHSKDGCRSSKNETAENLTVSCQCQNFERKAIVQQKFKKASLSIV